MPIEPHRAGNVSLLINERVFVRFDDPHLRVLLMLGDPFGGNEQVGKSVFRHGFTSLIYRKCMRTAY